MPTGEIEPRQVERLKEMGDWLRKYGKSVYGTRGGPYSNGRWGGATRKDKTVWLHVFEWNGDTLRLPALPAKVTGIRALTGGTPVFQQTSTGLDVKLAKADQDPINTVIELTLDKELPDNLVLGSSRSLADDPNYGEVLLKQPQTKVERSKPVVLDLGAVKSVSGISIVLAKGKIPAKKVVVSVSENGKDWESIHTFERMASPLEVSLSRTVAGAEVLGRPVHSIRIETDATLPIDHVKVLGKP